MSLEEEKSKPKIAKAGLVICAACVDKVVEVPNLFLNNFIHVRNELPLRPGDQVGAASLKPPATGQALLEKLNSLDVAPVVRRVAGGSGANTARMASWLLGRGTKARIAYASAVGSDSDADLFLNELTAAGCEIACAKIPGATGGPWVLIPQESKDRTIIFEQCAHTQYGDDQLWQDIRLLKGAPFLYATAWNLTTMGPARLRQFVGIAVESGVKVMLNLSATMFCRGRGFEDLQASALTKTTYLFGNEDEFRELASSLGWGSLDLGSVGSKLIAEVLIDSADAVVVITRGAEDAIVVSCDGVQSFPVRGCDNIVDTTGAGDSYVGGFLAGLLLDAERGFNLSFCMGLATFASWTILQHEGFTLPTEDADLSEFVS